MKKDSLVEEYLTSGEEISIEKLVAACNKFSDYVVAHMRPMKNRYIPRQGKQAHRLMGIRKLRS